MRVGFIGLGNVGGKLAGSLLRNGLDVMVLDLNPLLMESFAARGARRSESPKELAESCDVVITCLPSPAACAAVGSDSAAANASPCAIFFNIPSSPILSHLA